MGIPVYMTYAIIYTVIKEKIHNMKQEYEVLLTPWKIGNLEIKNRIVMAPMGGTNIFGWTEPSHFDR